MKFSCVVVKICKGYKSFYSKKKDLIAEKKRRKEIGFPDPDEKIVEFKRHYETKTVPELMHVMKRDFDSFFKQPKKGKQK